MSDHIHEQGDFIREIVNGRDWGYLWRCKHCLLERSKSYWQRYRADLKQIMEAIAANGLPNHEERVRATLQAAPYTTRHERIGIIAAYLAWQKEE